MRATRRLRYLLLGLFLYASFCAVGGVYLADGTLHPGRRPLTEDESVAVRQRACQLDADVQDVSITAPDGAVLRAWTVRPTDGNGSAVILLHGLGDNRVGTTGYAQLVVGYGYTVLDARCPRPRR